MQWNSSGKSASGKGSHAKTRKLRVESVEQRQMLSVANPIILAHPAPVTAEVASQNSEVNVEFQGSGQLTVNESESQTLVSQSGPGKTTQFASQDDGLNLAFAARGSLELNEGESQTLVSQSRPGRSTQIASQNSATDAYFAGMGSVSMSEANSETAFLRVR